MKKLFILMQLTIAAAAYSSYASADHGRHGHGHGRGYYDHPRHHHHGHYRPAHHYHEEVIYYAPPPVVHHYYPQPQVNYYPAPQARYDQRSGSGLVGGMLGSAFGYELGGGDPVAAGLGAAAGSYMGNRY